MFIEREFFSEGATLKGRWYGAENGPKAPCIVMCHGTSTTITMCLSDYASNFKKTALTSSYLITLDLAQVVEQCAKRSILGFKQRYFGCRRFCAHLGSASQWKNCALGRQFCGDACPDGWRGCERSGWHRVLHGVVWFNDIRL